MMDRESYEQIAPILEDIRTLAGNNEIEGIVELIDKIDGKLPLGIASKVK